MIGLIAEKTSNLKLVKSSKTLSKLESYKDDLPLI